jgi:hypothetical protein
MMSPALLDPLVAAGVVAATAAMDSVYVMFTAAGAARPGGELEQHLLSFVFLRRGQLHE